MNRKWQTSGHASDTGVGQVGVLSQTGLATDVSFRLWPRPSSPEVSTWNANHPVIFLIADLVEACGGSIANDRAFSAHFAGALQAISAAKVILRSLVEYSSCGDARAAGLAVAAYPATESVSSSEPSSAPLWLEQAEPGQLLVHPDTCKRLKNTPGMRFRPATLATSALAVSNEVYELIWASPKTIERYCQLVRSQSGATDNASAWINTAQVPDVVAETSSSVNSEQLQAEVPETSWPRENLEGDLDSESPSKKWYFVVTAALALVAAIGFGLRREWTPTQSPPPTRVSATDQVTAKPDNQLLEPQEKPTPSQAGAHEAAGPTVSTDATSGEQQQLRPEPAPITHEPGRPAAPSSAPTIKEQQTRSAGSTKERTDETGATTELSNTPPHDVTAEGFSRGDIPLLLRKADRDAAEGTFEDARHEYQIVLKLEPNNAEAKKGLYRLTLRERE